MSQAEELLNDVSEEVPVHTHPVPDTDTYFIIDPITRKIENTNRKKNVVMQYDHNSERFTFELPRYIDGHDMLECTSVTVNVDNIEVIESDSIEEVEPVEPHVNSDAPDITDLRAHPNDPEKAICSWLISRNSTQLAGILSFHIEFKCVDSNGNVVYEWSTDNYDEIEVRARKKNGEVAVVEHTDLLEQWRTRIFGAGDSVMATIAAEGEAQVAAVKTESETQQEAVELKGAQTLDSIPEDYTEVDAMADEAVRSKGDAIVCEAAGESIVLKDSSNDHIRGLKLLGKSTQVATTGVQLLDFDTEQHFTASTGYITLMRDVNPFTKGAGTYTFNCTGTIGNTYRLWVYEKGNNNSLIVNALSGDKFDLTEEQIAAVQNICIAASGFEVGTTYKGFIYPTIAYGSEPHEYEPYTGGKPSPNPEYPQEIVSVKNPVVNIDAQSIAIPHTLPGLPVTSGGNYTDSDGQQWICDEVDLERGVYVQRIGTKVFTGDERYSNFIDADGIVSSILAHKPNSPILCTHGKDGTELMWANDTYVLFRVEYLNATNLDEVKAFMASQNANGTPLTVQYVLDAPIETPLTAEEITAFKALRTNYPNTTILNDAGAWMSVKYNADTKTYVENPKTLKLVDSSTGVVYELKIVDGNLTVNPI